jgi:hypothetical protein
MGVLYLGGQQYEAGKPILHEDYGDHSGAAFAIRAGGGVDVYLNERIAINMEATYVVPVTRVTRLDYLSLGISLQYHF